MLEPHTSVEYYYSLTSQLCQTMSSDRKFPKPSNRKPYGLAGIVFPVWHHFMGSTHRSGSCHLANAKHMRQQQSGNTAQQDHDEQAPSIVSNASQKVHLETFGLADIRELR